MQGHKVIIQSTELSSGNVFTHTEVSYDTVQRLGSLSKQHRSTASLV